MTLYHITTLAAWQGALAEGRYQPSTLASEGFIHLSTEQQWRKVANTFFAGQQDLVLLCLRQEQLGPALRFDDVEGESFPHLYGPLELSSVAEVFALNPTEAGSFEQPGQRLS